MSKFIVSNKCENVEKVVSHNEMYPVNAEWDALGVKCVVFDKRAQHHNDILWDGLGGAFIVGTPLFRDGIDGDDIAEYVYEHTSDNGISGIKNDVVGYWAALVVKDGALYVFNDYYGIYDVLYSQENGIFSIGCELSDVVRCRRTLEYDEYPFVMENFQMGAFPGLTSFKGINKVKPNTYLKIEGGNLFENEIIRKQISYKFSNVNKAIEDVTALIKSYAERISRRYSPMSIGMTGGLDSRLVFAAFKAVDAKISFMHGIHSGGRSEDGAIVKELSKAYQIPLEIVDWEQPKSFCLEDQEDVFEEVGFSNYIAVGCKKHFEQFYDEATHFPFKQSGYFCEAIRLREWAEKKGKTFSLQDYVDNYFIDKTLRNAYVNYDSYRDYLMKGFVNQLREMGYEGELNRIPIDLFERFRWNMSRFHDSRSVVCDNMNHYHFSLLAVPYIHEAILSLPADVIKNGSFQIKVIEKLDPNLLKFDVFSHRRAFYIKNYKKRHKLTMKNIADVVLEKTPALKKILVNTYQRIKYSSAAKQNLMANQIKEMNVKLPDYLDLEAYEGSLVRLRAFAIGLHCIQNS